MQICLSIESEITFALIKVPSDQNGNNDRDMANTVAAHSNILYQQQYVFFSV